MSEIPKAYEPQAVEAKWYQFWLDHGCFTADPARVSERRPAYSIVIPPPNVTGVLTMGHVLNNTIQDILARKARMDGKEVLWLPGTDHAGIATENMVAKQLRKEEKKTKQDLGREEFIQRVWAWKEKHGGIIIQQLKKLGCSCDWTRERFTMDPEYVRCVQRVFVDLYQKGLIYRGKRMVNWCPVSLTALSDEEVVMKEQKGFLYYFKVEVAAPAEFTGSAPAPGAGASARAGGSGRANSSTAPSISTPPDAADEASAAAREARALPGSDGKIWLTIATTRPETIPADTAVAVNPKDPRYAHLVGKHVRRALPLEDQTLIPIIADEHIDIEFGTGVLKVTPAHDAADFDIGQRHHLPVIDVLNPNGTMNKLAGKDLVGLDRAEARKKAAELLEAAGALVKTEPYVNNVGFSERADVPIEPRLSEQWFLKYPGVDEARACVEQPEKQNAPGGKPLVAHPVEGTLGSQPAPGAADLGGASTLVPHRHVSEDMIIQTAPSASGNSAQLVEHSKAAQMRFHPDRWAKVYDHWMANIKDWCISRQLWWGHRIPVWYNEEAKAKLEKKLPVIEVSGNELSGANIKELRAAAWDFAEKHSLLNRTFRNDETGWDILVRPASLEHAFTHLGPPNIKVVVALPEIIRSAVKVGTLWHVPENENFKRVHLFVAVARVAGELYQVKITVKEHVNGQKLYDHQLFKVEAPDGVSPMPAAVASEPTRPTSGAELQIGVLFRDVNTDTTFVRCQIESPGEGWSQDPDVLDTWFSSWLWPFATMGWTGDKETDARNETLKKFYPTTDLVTGPDIIFFWVARMIMAGYEYMGEMPFRNVYFTGIIRDKQGRKMSKSLGNSPDPLDLIARYGADALRFGTMRSAPLGQDILFDEQNVELGRNFCNKLWNACRFRQMQGGESEGEINPALLTSDDRWILLRLDQAIREVSQAFAEYKFSDATATLYRFFWSEYCDWYVEASKAAFGNAERGTRNAEQRKLAANKLAVIDFVLGHLLRLFHPFLPFITEELWQGMGFHREMPAGQGGRTIMFAPWPKAFSDDEKAWFGLDEAADQVARAKYDLVTLGRNLKAQFNVPAGKRVKFILKPAGALPPAEAEVIKTLLNAEPLELVNADCPPPKGLPVAANALGALYLPLEGLVDFAAERARLTKELARARAEVARVQDKLANPNFAQKVPARVLEEHQKRLADWRGKVAQVEQALANLPG